MQFTEKSDRWSDDESKSCDILPFVQPGHPDYKESRTTHLEKQLDKVLLGMQV